MCAFQPIMREMGTSTPVATCMAGETRDRVHVGPHAASARRYAAARGHTSSSGGTEEASTRIQDTLRNIRIRRHVRIVAYLGRVVNIGSLYLN